MNTIFHSEKMIDGVTIRNSIASPGALMEAIETISDRSKMIIYDPSKNEDVEYRDIEQSNRIYLEDGIYASYTGCGSFVTFYPTAKARGEAKNLFHKLEAEIFSTKEIQIPTICAEFDLYENSKTIPCLYLEAEERGEGQTCNGMIYGVIVNPQSYARNKKQVKKRTAYSTMLLHKGKRFTIPSPNFSRSKHELLIPG